MEVPTGVSAPPLTSALELAERPSYAELSRRTDAPGNMSTWLIADARSQKQLMAHQLRYLLAAEGEMSIYPRDEHKFYATRDNDWSDLYARTGPSHPPVPPPVVPAGVPLAAADHLLDEHRDAPVGGDDDHDAMET